MPCDGANGLFPGRVPPGLGAGRAPGFGAAGFLAAASAGVGAAVFGVGGASDAGRDSEPGSGAGAVSGFGAGSSGACSAWGADSACDAGSAFGAGLAGGFGVADLGRAGASFLAGAGAAESVSGNASRRRRWTGGSIVDEADLTNSPSSFSFARTVLLSTPSSFASS